ncbi:50S ribosomal protein L15 [Candidatus Woesearchaeota archaeon]|nr:50S ribosomal protein L15 [Candidatus Woesearchaeota archaeon]
MVRRKIRRMRASRRHGWGKHHRGKGNKGGSGNAGRGKRSDHKKPSYREKRLGKYGFTSHSRRTRDTTISFAVLEDKLQTWLDKKLVEEKDGVIIVDLGKLGYTKLLASGKLTRKLRISVPTASKRAVEKIKEAGGEAS